LNAYKDDPEPAPAPETAPAPAPETAPEPKKKFIPRKKPEPVLALMKDKSAPQKEEIPERQEDMTASEINARKKFIPRRPEPAVKSLTEFEKAKKKAWDVIHHVYALHTYPANYGR
jgi:hypothetical protein